MLLCLSLESVNGGQICWKYAKTYWASRSWREFKKKKKGRKMHMVVSQCGCCYQRVTPGFGNFWVVDAALNYNKTVADELFKALSSQQDAGVTLAFVSAWKTDKNRLLIIRLTYDSHLAGMKQTFDLLPFSGARLQQVSDGNRVPVCRRLQR